MKFQCVIDVNCPKEQVVDLFKDPNLLKHYQEGFISKELLSGHRGKEGAVSLLKYQQGSTVMELTETITENNLPNSYKAFYHHKNMDNTILCRFEALSPDSTRYLTDVEYTAFRGFVPKMMSLIFPGFFKKQVERWLQNFKLFAEAHYGSKEQVSS